MKEKVKIIVLGVVFIVFILLINNYVQKRTSENINSDNTPKSIANSDENAMESANVVELTDDNFDSFVNTEKKVLVDFYATWCGPCKMLSPIIDEVANENNEVLFARVDVDKCEILSSKYKIEAMPTLIVFENGKEIERSVGLIDKESVVELIK